MRKSTAQLSMAVLLALTLLAAPALADTRLFVPAFSSGNGEDTQLLLANNNDHPSKVDLWTFSSNGSLLGQVQLTLAAHSTKSLTMSQALHLARRGSIKGWIGAVSPDAGIQMSYVRLGDIPASGDVR